jgi:hypothetical protein
MQPVLRWLGSLLAPAEDPRRGAVNPAGVPDPAGLLAELQRARAELAQLRVQIEARTPGSRIAEDLASEEQELQEAEECLSLSLDEQRAKTALAKAAEARLRAEY